MDQSNAELCRSALRELQGVFDRADDNAVEHAVSRIRAARRIAVFGGGREGLQVRGFAMRLFHLGLQAAVVGDMTTPAIGRGDLLWVTCGPGEISTAVALVGVAKAAGAEVIVVTAQPSGRVPRMADAVVTLPAQTMADDRAEDQDGGLSVLPMGSLFEGALFVLFEIMVLRLKAEMGITAEGMRSNHTNLE